MAPQAVSAATTRLAPPHTTNDSGHAQPQNRLSQATNAAINNNHADAPNTMPSAVNASVRPNALRASERSALNRMLNAGTASRPAAHVARPVSPSSRKASAMPGVGRSAPGSAPSGRSVPAPSVPSLPIASAPDYLSLRALPIFAISQPVAKAMPKDAKIGSARSDK